MDIVVKIAQLVLALSLLVLIHEMGHFLFARLFKIRVDKFYLFFNPSFSIVRTKKFNGRWNFSFFSSAPPVEWEQYPENTEYGVGWLPMGGYCKIAGMIDESMDKEQMKEPPQSWEFRTKAAWKRLLVMVGGVLFNIIFGFLVYAGILYTWGDTYLANDDVVYGVQVSSLAQEMGFRNGDKVLYLDDEEVTRFSDIQMTMMRNRSEKVTILRENDTLSLTIDEKFLPMMLRDTELLFDIRTPFVIESIPDTSHNVRSGLREGDRIVGIDSIPMYIVQDIQEALQIKKNKMIMASVLRGGDTLQIPLSIDADGKVGISLQSLDHHFDLTTQEYGFLTAVPAGIKKGAQTIRNYWKELGLIFSPKTEAYKNVGSFITIGKIFPSDWDWFRFWNITAFLSIMLAVLNVLPIPALDGGHIVFVVYEMITGRKPSDKILEYAQVVGMFIILAIMVLAFGNDIYRLFK